MKKEQLEEYKAILLGLRKNILNSGILKSSEDLRVSPEDLPDEADLATNVINQQVSFSMRNREMEKLRQIEEALLRIEEGIYGICEDCDEEIEEARLRNQPWTNLCIIHAEERERENLKYLKKYKA